jgi:hypothetical protein
LAGTTHPVSEILLNWESKVCWAPLGTAAASKERFLAMLLLGLNHWGRAMLIFCRSHPSVSRSVSPEPRSRSRRAAQPNGKVQCPDHPSELSPPPAVPRVLKNHSFSRRATRYRINWAPCGLLPWGVGGPVDLRAVEPSNLARWLVHIKIAYTGSVPSRCFFRALIG